MNKEIRDFNKAKTGDNQAMCELLAKEIDQYFDARENAENKIWHGAPVWFLNGNPIVGYDTLKDCVRLLFWSGQSFDEPGLHKEGTFKAAEARYTAKDEISIADLRRWLKKSETIQWDYKNIVKKRGQLDRLK
jgi:hypothetical protein